MDERTRDTTMNDEPLKQNDDANFDELSAAQQQQADERSSLEQVLTKPIQAHGEELHILRWREPTGADIERAGNPIIVDFFGEKPSLTFNEKKMSAMISALCQVPPSTVRQLTAGDWNSIAWKLVRFFMPQMAG
jgi:hypothetical protein